MSYDASSAKACGLGLELVKTILVIENIAFFVGGIILLILGGISLAGGQVSIYINFSIPQLPIGTVVVGVFITVVSFLGCFGGARENKKMLGVYFCILLLLFMASLALAFAAFSELSQVDAVLEDGWKHFDDSIQEWMYNHWQCCGFDKPDNSSFCHKLDLNHTLIPGCKQALIAYAHSQLTIVEVTGAIFGCFLFFGLLFTVCVWTAIPTQEETREAEKREILRAARAMKYETVI